MATAKKAERPSPQSYITAQQKVAKKKAAVKYDPSQPPKKEVVRKNGDSRYYDPGYGRALRKITTIKSEVESKPATKLEKKIVKKLKPIGKKAK